MERKERDGDTGYCERSIRKRKDSVIIEKGKRKSKRWLLMFVRRTREREKREEMTVKKKKKGNIK